MSKVIFSFIASEVRLAFDLLSYLFFFVGTNTLVRIFFVPATVIVSLHLINFYNG